MNRRQLTEFGDLPLPGPFRDAYAHFLNTALRHSYGAAIEPLAKVLLKSGQQKIVDLGAGKGGYWPTLLERLRARGQSPKVTLTDRYPVASARPGIDAHPVPIDFRQPSIELGGVWTMFAALHHLAPDELNSLLDHCARNGRAFCAVEITERALLPILMMPVSMLMAIIAAACERPRRAAVLFWTFVLPVLPLMYCWDGVASHLRTYTAADLRTALKDSSYPGYRWELGEAGGDGICPKIAYLVGWPCPAPTPAALPC